MLRSVHGTGFSPFTRYIRVTQNVAIPTLSTSIDLTKDTVSYVLVEPRLKEKEGTLYSIEVGSISGPEWQTSFAGTSLLFFFFWVQQNRWKINREHYSRNGSSFSFPAAPSKRLCVPIVGVLRFKCLWNRAGKTAMCLGGLIAVRNTSHARMPRYHDWSGSDQ